MYYDEVGDILKALGFTSWAGNRMYGDEAGTCAYLTLRHDDVHVELTPTDNDEQRAAEVADALRLRGCVVILRINTTNEEI